MTANLPPNGVYHKPFQGEEVRTVDGVVIEDGLRVFTNNLDRGRISLERANFEWHSGMKRYVLWFIVECDTSYKGELMTSGYMQSDNRVTTRWQGKAA